MALDGEFGEEELYLSDGFNDFFGDNPCDGCDHNDCETCDYCDDF